MMDRALISAGVVFALFGAWMLIQQAGRRFAHRHPEFGRFREEGGACGKTCGCANWKNCAMKKAKDTVIEPKERPSISRHSMIPSKESS